MVQDIPIIACNQKQTTFILQNNVNRFSASKTMSHS